VIYVKSGRRDSNSRLPAPKAGALARLRHAPIIVNTLQRVTYDFAGPPLPLRVLSQLRLPTGELPCDTGPPRRRASSRRKTYYTTPLPARKQRRTASGEAVASRLRIFARLSRFF
jgi:hypothetical protein